VGLLDFVFSPLGLALEYAAVPVCTCEKHVLDPFPRQFICLQLPGSQLRFSA